MIPSASAPSEYPPKPLSLPSGEIHLWLADLDRPAPAGDSAAAGWLDALERERAARLISARERRRFQRSRGILRQVLGGYLGLDPASVSLGVGSEGKPHLLDDARRPRCDLRFNLSHASALWALAVRRDAEVGVDVERTDRKADVEGVAQRMFAPGEVGTLARLEGEEAKLAFFRVWSTREAVVKCLGTGMFALEAEFEVEADCSRPLEIRPAPDPAAPAEPGRSRRSASAGHGAAELPVWVGEIPLSAGLGGVLASRQAPAGVRVWTVPVGPGPG